MAEGWVKFEKVCSEVGAGELSQLLHYLKFTMTLNPTSTPMTPVKQEVKQEEEATDVVDIKIEDKPIIEKLIHISQGGQTVEYRCGNCDIAPKRAKVGKDTYIRNVHTNKALLCSFYAFLTYN